MWHDSTGSHRQEAALVDYSAGVVCLFSPDGTLLEIHESKLSPDGLNYVRSLDVDKRWKWKVTVYPIYFPTRSLISSGTGNPTRYVPVLSVHCYFV